MIWLFLGALTLIALLLWREHSKADTPDEHEDINRPR